MPFCSRCGANVGQGAQFCSTCGQPMSPIAARVVPPPPPPVAQSAPAYAEAPVAPPSDLVGCAVLQPRPVTVAYAGFWLRFVAWFIDAIVLGIGGGILTAPFTGLGLMNLHSLMRGGPPSPDMLFGHGFIFRAFIVKQLLHWAYYSLLESSTWQATLGKKALGLEVTDMNGARISFGHATGRWAARYVSVMTLGIGYLMAGFTARKQALHDLIAGTLVIRKI
jgi:uncharacterized RDD family membrane protein YckC